MSVDIKDQPKHQQANAKHRLHHIPPVSSVAGTSSSGPQLSSPSREWRTIEDNVEEFFKSRPLKQDWMRPYLMVTVMCYLKLPILDLK